LWSSCSVSKWIPEDKQLARKARIIIQNPDKVPNPNQLKQQLALKIKPTIKYGIGNTGLWIYYKTKTDKEKGLKQWINRKFGKAPVYYDSKVFDRSSIILQNGLHENGYFGSEVRVDTTSEGAFVDIEFGVNSKGRYTIDSIIYPADTVPFAELFQPSRRARPIVEGQWYRKSNIDKERDRLYDKLGAQGYLDFEKSSILFYVDTTKADLKADIYIDIADNRDSSNMNRYVIGETYVFPDYNLNKADSITIRKDTIHMSRLDIIQSSEVLKPKTISRAILQDKESLASTKTQYVAINRFQNLGVFKFTNASFQKRVNDDGAFLDRYFYLTPSLTQDLIGEAEVNNRTGDFFGSALSATYTHRNLFGGAERFDASISGGIETQFGQATSFTNTLDFNASVGLTIPHFVLPFRWSVKNSNSAKTTIKIGNSLQIRKDFFTISAFNTSLSYRWQPNNKTTLQVTPINLNLVNLVSTSAAFDTLLSETPRLRSSFENTFILGLDFAYTYNSQTSGTNDPYLFATFKVGTSGNLLSLFDGSLKDDGEGFKQFLGARYAQYLKIVPEVRYYIPHKNGLLATRLGLGVGLSYANSDQLPYIEQFFVGGSNSIRAFRLRQLGPGSFLTDQVDENVAFFDQTGDIKFEANIDYRVNLGGFFKGAIFLDAANIWSLRSDTRPEGVFKIDQFYKEIAIGTGVGLRLDFDFFVLRLDGSFALRRPTVDGFKWVIDEVDILDKGWRSDNVVWNLAIGYPF